jgi:hypothetical protein
MWRSVPGRTIEASDEQPENAEVSIVESAESVSNVTLERYSQSAKQDSPSASTAEGRQIVRSDRQCQKVNRSIRDSLEPNSNVIDERDGHREKQA